jgi:hypothetical protein
LEQHRCNSRYCSYRSVLTAQGAVQVQFEFKDVLLTWPLRYCTAVTALMYTRQILILSDKYRSSLPPRVWAVHVHTKSQATIRGIL